MGKWTEGIGQRRLWKAEEFDGLKPTVYDWCRVAAYIDGEGHLNINPSKTRIGNQRFTSRILIGNTNPALAIWLKDTFGGNIIIRQSRRWNPRAKDAYIWSCTAARACWILHNCTTWMLLKKDQARILMELQLSVDGTRQGRGRSVDLGVISYRSGLNEELHKLNAKGLVIQLTGE